MIVLQINTLKITTGFRNYTNNEVKIISNIKNNGLTNTKKYRCFSCCTGSWLALLDSDDVWFSNHLETLMNKEVSKDPEINLVLYPDAWCFLNNV
jgi:glycosyltransferase involved in cell wall biosynthesis